MARTSRKDKVTAAEAGCKTREGGPSRAGLRLLSALAEDDARALPDPTQPDGAFLVRARAVGGTASSGVTLGRGLHPAATLAELARADLVARTGDGAPCWEITAAGRAHLARREAGGADAFAAQHRDLVRGVVHTEDGAARVVANAGESPLAWLRRRRDRDGEAMIGPAAFEAGERLRRDLTAAALLPSVTARWDGSVGGGGGAPHDRSVATDVVIDARRRVRDAMEAVGPDMADLLVDLCGFLKGLETLERDRRWPPRSAKVVLRLALDRLAAHYGLGDVATGPARSRIRTWEAALEAA